MLAPLTVIFSGAAAKPQTQATGTMGASSTTAGRRLKIMMDVLVFGTEILERKFSTFDVVAVGADEVAAADALVVLFEERFGESE